MRRRIRRRLRDGDVKWHTTFGSAKFYDFVEILLTLDGCFTTPQNSSKTKRFHAVLFFRFRRKLFYPDCKCLETTKTLPLFSTFFKKYSTNKKGPSIEEPFIFIHTGEFLIYPRVLATYRILSLHPLPGYSTYTLPAEDRAHPSYIKRYWVQ